MESNAKAEPAQSDKMKIYVRGGVGDILQSWWYIHNNKDDEYIVHSHYKNVKEIFDYLGAKNVSYYNFSDMESHNDGVDAILKDFGQEIQQQTKDIPRAFYSSFAFSFQDEELSLSAFESFEKDQYTVGIHPFRSDFAQSVYKDHNLPCSILPLEVAKSVIEEDKNYLIFGRSQELSDYGLEEPSNVKFVSFPSILTSLNTIKYCKKFIGLDSCFKSMSSMQRIPTLCVIGDFPDNTRDVMFIDQYVKDSVMTVIKTKNTTEDQEYITTSIKRFINDE